jgi:hypothetical protein
MNKNVRNRGRSTLGLSVSTQPGRVRQPVCSRDCRCSRTHHLKPGSSPSHTAGGPGVCRSLGFASVCRGIPIRQSDRSASRRLDSNRQIYSLSLTGGWSSEACRSWKVLAALRRRAGETSGQRIIAVFRKPRYVHKLPRRISHASTSLPLSYLWNYILSTHFPMPAAFQEFTCYFGEFTGPL